MEERLEFGCAVDAGRFKQGRWLVRYERPAQVHTHDLASRGPGQPQRPPGVFKANALNELKRRRQRQYARDHHQGQHQHEQEVFQRELEPCEYIARHCRQRHDQQRAHADGDDGVEHVAYELVPGRVIVLPARRDRQRPEVGIELGLALQGKEQHQEDRNKRKQHENDRDKRDQRLKRRLPQLALSAHDPYIVHIVRHGCRPLSQFNSCVFMRRLNSEPISITMNIRRPIAQA